MTIDEVTRLMAQLPNTVSRLTREAAREIIAITQQYSFLGESFSFSFDEDLDRQINLLLVRLSDEVMEEATRRAEKTVEEEDRETALIWARREQDGQDPTYRLDRHCSDLKIAMEGYIAVCFANAYTEGRMLASLNAFLNSPNTWGPAREKYGPNPFHFGRGMASDPAKGMTLVAQGFVNDTYQRGVILGYSHDPTIIGYKVHRNSTYDCPLCDELCVGIHPLDEQVLPAHPRCVCYTTPVRASDIL